MKLFPLSALATLCLTLGTMSLHAQTDFTGRIYKNANIMELAMKNETKDFDKEIENVRNEGIAKAEKEKGRKLTTDELAELDKQLEKGRKMFEAMKKGMKMAITIEFKTDKDIVMKQDTKISDEILKAAGISWIKRKAIKAALALAPSSEKDTYVVKGNMIIVGTGKDMDTLYILNNGQQLQGQLDKNTKFTLNRVATTDTTTKKK